MAYDVIVEVNKIDRIVEVEKFNPYHDSKGRFTTEGGGGKFYATPGKSKAHDNAIARQKERDDAAAKLESIGGQGAASVKAALKEGAKWDANTQQRIATRINESKILRLEDFVDNDGDERYNFRMYGYDKAGNSVSSKPKKKWYSYETAVALAALATLRR